jgi:3-dehydroquinate dehydratase/shikimate dehydrogenase
MALDSTPEKLICVPITEPSLEDFMQATAAASSVADAIELRVDYLTEGDASRAIKLFSDPKNKIQKPLILTHRPREQGGQREISFGDRREFWRGFSDWESIAYADLEFDLVEHLAKGDTPVRWEQVICSWHDFAETPHDLIARYDLMASAPAAVVKIATRAKGIGDCLRIFELIEHAKGKKPVIALAMGLPGLMTRVLALSRGAILTFGSLQRGAESAPGQPTAAELRDLYRVKELSPDSMILGIIGNPVGHSRSPLMHNAALRALNWDGVYLPFEVDDAGSFLCGFVHPRTKKLDWHLRGLSVTIPHKLAVIPYLDFIDATAKTIGAVNTVVVEGDQLHGYNTDAAGAMKPLDEMIDMKGARVAVLGAGGSARAVCYGLRERGADVTIYARDLEKARPLADEFNARIASLESFSGQADVVINCTPIGMHGHSEGRSPVAAETLKNTRLVYDLIYTPEETALLLAAKQAGCQTLGGLAMLVNQAAEQFRLWTGSAAPVDVMWEALRHSGR